MDNNSYRFNLPSCSFCAIMINGDFMRIYEFCTQWLSLGMLFFIVDYYTEWLEVVTLGGLVAGSLLIGLWTTALDRLGSACAAHISACAQPQPWQSHRQASALPEMVHKGIVLLGVLLGVYAISEILPGYTLVLTGPFVACLLAYGLVAISLGRSLSVKK